MQLVHLIIFCVSFQDISKRQSLSRSLRPVAQRKETVVFPLSFLRLLLVTIVFIIFSKILQHSLSPGGFGKGVQGSPELSWDKSSLRVRSEGSLHTQQQASSPPRVENSVDARALASPAGSLSAVAVCLPTDNRLSAVREVRGLVGLRGPAVRDAGWAGEFPRVLCSCAAAWRGDCWSVGPRSWDAADSGRTPLIPARAKVIF